MAQKSPTENHQPSIQFHDILALCLKGRGEFDIHGCMLIHIGVWGVTRVCLYGVLPESDYMGCYQSLIIWGVTRVCLYGVLPESDYMGCYQSLLIWGV